MSFQTPGSATKLLRENVTQSKKASPGWRFNSSGRPVVPLALNLSRSTLSLIGVVPLFSTRRLVEIGLPGVVVSTTGSGEVVRLKAPAAAAGAAKAGAERRDRPRHTILKHIYRIDPRPQQPGFRMSLIIA